jgi:hypothetical protein
VKNKQFFKNFSKNFDKYIQSVNIAPFFKNLLTQPQKYAKIINGERRKGNRF